MFQGFCFSVKRYFIFIREKIYVKVTSIIRWAMKEYRIDIQKRWCPTGWLRAGCVSWLPIVSKWKEKIVEIKRFFIQQGTQFICLSRVRSGSMERFIQIRSMERGGEEEEEEVYRSSPFEFCHRRSSSNHKKERDEEKRKKMKNEKKPNDTTQIDRSRSI